MIVEMSGKLIEVQIRTSLQHLWAELSEKLSDTIDPKIKYGGGDEEVRQTLDRASELVARCEIEIEMPATNFLRTTSEQTAKEVMEGLQELLEAHKLLAERVFRRLFDWVKEQEGRSR